MNKGCLRTIASGFIQVCNLNVLFPKLTIKTCYVHLTIFMCLYMQHLTDFSQGSTALNKLHRVLINKRVLSDVEKLSPHYQTSTVEAFHKVILHFAPKNVVFPFIGMLCRYVFSPSHIEHSSEHNTYTIMFERGHTLFLCF